MHRELVARDGWITEERFRKVLALYQTLPGPEAHELAVYFGMLRGGRWGGFLAGLGFMLPGVVLVTILAALYVAYGSQEALVDMLLYGVKPAAVALVAAAAVRLTKSSLTAVSHVFIAVAALLATVLLPEIHFLIVLACGALAGLALQRHARPVAAALLPLPLLFGAGATWPLFLALSALSLQVGLLTFGGAYTALPILHQGAVVEQGWLTERQFVDGLALAALVPGPLIAIGTFVGYLVGGVPGAALATVLIFTPAFLFTLVGHHYFERLVDRPRVHDALVGVMAAAIGLIAALSVSLARAAIVDVPSALIAVVGFAVILWRPYVAWVVIGGAAVGAVIRIIQVGGLPGS